MGWKRNLLAEGAQVDAENTGDARMAYIFDSYVDPLIIGSNPKPSSAATRALSPCPAWIAAPAELGVQARPLPGHQQRQDLGSRRALLQRRPVPIPQPEPDGPRAKRRACTLRPRRRSGLSTRTPSAYPCGAWHRPTFVGPLQPAVLGSVRSTSSDHPPADARGHPGQ